MLVGIQTGGITEKYGNEKGYRMIRDAGFEAIDWNLDHALPRTKLEKATELKNICIFEEDLDSVMAHYEKELDIIRQNGLVISQAHAPFPAYMPERPEMLDYTIGIYKRCIEFCDAVGCKNLVIHGISSAPDDPDNTLDDIKALNYKLYESLIDTLKTTNVKVCLENLPSKYKLTSTIYELCEGICSNPYEAVEYIDTLNQKAGKDCFGLCLDTGHLHLTKKRFNAYLPIVNNRICALHIHDNTALFDTHKAPYSGTILWDEFTEEMNKIEYNGDLCFETFRQMSVPEELSPVFLKLIYEIGCYFRKEITK